MPTSLFTVLLFSMLTSTTLAADIYQATDAKVKNHPQKNTQPSISAGAKRAKPSSCEEEWKKFHDSAACFARYRIANGSVKAEAYKHCVEVKQPLALCE